MAPMILFRSARYCCCRVATTTASSASAPFLTQLQVFGQNRKAFCSNAIQVVKSCKSDSLIEIPPEALAALEQHAPSVELDGYNMMVDMYSKSNNIDLVSQALDDMQSQKFVPCLETYFNLLIMCYEIGTLEALRRAEGYWNELRENLLTPTKDMYQLMLQFYQQHTEVKNTEDIFFEMMQKDYADANGYNVLFKLYDAMNDWESAEDMVLGMRLHKIPMNEAVYVTLIKFFARERRYHRCQQLFHQFKMQGLQPTQAIFAAMIEVYARQKRYDIAENTFQYMQNCGLPPDPDSLLMLYYCYEAQGDNDRMEDVLTRMRFTTNINMRGWVELLVYYGRIGDIDKVEEVWGEIGACGFRHNHECYNSIIHVYKTHGIYKKMFDKFDHMRRFGVMPNDVTYTIFFGLWKKIGSLTECQNVYQQMKEDGVTPSEYIFRNFHAMLERAGLTKQADDVFEDMLRAGYGREPTPPMDYKAVVERHWQEQKLKEDQHLSKKMHYKHLRKLQGIKGPLHYNLALYKKRPVSLPPKYFRKNQ